MQYTPNYNMTLGEGSDIVNPLTQIFPNFSTIDTQMKSNEDAAVGTATEVTTGSVHAITRANTSNPVFRFTATSAWASGDTMTVDGNAVTVHTTSGQTPDSGVYIIGAEVLCILNGALVTMYATKQKVEESVSVTGDGVKTNSQVLDDLFAATDLTKITPASKIVRTTSTGAKVIFPIMLDYSGLAVPYMNFVSVGFTGAFYEDNEYIRLQSSVSSYGTCTAGSRSNRENEICPAGMNFRLFY